MKKIILTIALMASLFTIACDDSNGISSSRETVSLKDRIQIIENSLVDGGFYVCCSSLVSGDNGLERVITMRRYRECSIYQIPGADQSVSETKMVEMHYCEGN